MSVDDTKPAPLSAARLAEIRARESRATAGPWRVSTQSHDDRPRTEEVCDLVNDTWVVTDHHLSNYRDDAAFIAHARQDIPALLAHLDALTPREVDGDALGRAVLAVESEGFDNALAWEDTGRLERDRLKRIGVRLHAIGYAAGAVAMTGEGDDPAVEGAVYILMERHDRELHAAHAAGRSEGEAERGALTPRAPSTREQRVERLGKLARELLQIGEDTVSEYLARDAEIARLTAALDAERALTAELRAMEAEAGASADRWRAASERHERERDALTAELAEARAAWRESEDRRQATVATLDTLAAEHEAASAREREAIREAAEARATIASAADKSIDDIETARRFGYHERDAELAAARLDGAREEREAIGLHLLTAYQATHYEGPAAAALAEALDWLRVRGEGGGR